MKNWEKLFVIILIGLLAIIGYIAVERANYVEDTGGIWQVPEPTNWPTEEGKDKG